MSQKNKKLHFSSGVFSRSVDGIITDGELEKALQSGRRLRIKFGADVTAASLHIGHAVNLWKMRELQDNGHKVVFLIGDFTTRIGDPTGRPDPRGAVNAKNIGQWSKDFISQIKKILRTDKGVFEVRRNSEWYSRMKARDFLDLLSLFTHSRLIEREMFRKRIKEGSPIQMPELLYPVLQGYDSVMLKSDLTIIGSDQLFNENIGRFLQEKFGQPPQILITTTITPGLDGGEKMSKSKGNYIGLDDLPADKFGKAMRLIDSLIIDYLKAYTDVPLEEISQWEKRLRRGTNPMEAKLFFAESLVGRYHGAAVAANERTRFLKVFSERRAPQDLPPTPVAAGEWDPAELLIRLRQAPSKSEARRLIEQGAVSLGEEPIADWRKKIVVSREVVLKVGKHRFVKIKPGRVYKK